MSALNGFNVEIDGEPLSAVHSEDSPHLMFLLSTLVQQSLLILCMRS